MTPNIHLDCSTTPSVATLSPAYTQVRLQSSTSASSNTQLYFTAKW